MTISKRLQLKLFLLIFSSTAGLSVAPLMAEDSTGPMVIAVERRNEYQPDLKHVLTSGQTIAVAAAPLAVIHSETVAIKSTVLLQPAMVSNSMSMPALAEGARYWIGEQRRMAM